EAEPVAEVETAVEPAGDEAVDDPEAAGDGSEIADEGTTGPDEEQTDECAARDRADRGAQPPQGPGWCRGERQDAEHGRRPGRGEEAPPPLQEGGHSQPPP